MQSENIESNRQSRKKAAASACNKSHAQLAAFAWRRKVNELE